MIKLIDKNYIVSNSNSNILIIDSVEENREKLASFLLDGERISVDKVDCVECAFKVL